MKRTIKDIEQVKIEATYERSRLVPQIGTRRRMNVNGSEQFMTLNEIHVIRCADWDSPPTTATYKFTTKEFWGSYFLC